MKSLGYILSSVIVDNIYGKHLSSKRKKDNEKGKHIGKKRYIKDNLKVALVASTIGAGLSKIL